MALSVLRAMDFEPTPEQRRLVELAEAFGERRGAELPADAEGFATEACAALGEDKLLDVATTLDAALVTGALARTSAALGATFAAQWLFIDALLRRAGRSQALAALASGARAAALTGAVALGPTGEAGGEPVATDDGERLRVTGTTAPTALVPVASEAIVAARRREGGMAIACVRLASPGVRRIPSPPGLGLQRLPRGSVELTAAELPHERVLDSGDAAVATVRALARTRSVLTAAVAVGVAKRALDSAVARVRAMGKTRQSTEFVVSDLATGHDAAFLATAHAAWLVDQGAGAGAESAAAKLVATRIATEICHGALGVCGGDGHGDDLRRAYLDARQLELDDGAEAEQIDIVASRMLGES